MSNRGTKNTPFLIVLPGLYLAAVLCIDYNCPLGLLTPFFVVLGLLAMAIKFRPSIMIPWGVVYTVVVCALFLSPKLFELFSGKPYYTQYVIPSIRAGTYVMVGSLSIYLCVALNRLRKSEAELTHILDNLPSPIIKSDHNGKILYWNASAEKLIPELQTEELLVNYFDLLAPLEFHGRTIMQYLKRFETRGTSEPPLELRLKGVLYLGHVQRLEFGGKVFLLTILERKG